MNFFSLTEILCCPLRLFVLSTGSEVLWSYSSLHKEGWGTGIFSGQVFKCDLSVYRVLQISLFICDVSPFLDQVFRCFFSMDNLRGYGEDEPASSSSLGRSVAKLPSSSEGPSAPLPAQASVMAGSSPAVVPVTSGPVPTVSALSQPASSVPQDSAPPPPGLLDDLSPPPSPAEPYEDFMACVRRELSTLPAHPTQSVAAVPPRASVTATTTGTRLPTSFPRFEDSSWAFQPQVPNTRIWMPLPASCYTAPPSPWVWPGRGSSLPLPWSVYTSLLHCRLPPQDLVDLQDVSQDLSQGALPLFLHLRFLLLTSSTPPPPRFRGFFFRVPRPLLPKPPQHLRHRPLPAWTLSLPRWRSRMQGPFPRDLPRRWSKGGKKNSWSTWKPIGNSLWVTLHLSKQWVPLFLLRTWAPTRCGSWVPLTTERRHGLSVRPGQNELAVASVAVVDPARGHLLTEIGLGSDGLKCLLTPPRRPDACLLLPSAHDGTSVMSPVSPVHQKVISAPHGHAILGDLAHHFPAVVVLHLLLHLTAGPGIARLPLVVLSGPTWLGGLLGVHPCRHADVHLLLTGGHNDHPGAISHPLRPEPGPLIVVQPYPPPGHLHLKDIGPVVCLRVVTAPGLPARSVSLNHMHQTYASYDST